MITKEHLDQMRHAVGYHSNNPGYRNAFHTNPDDKVWQYLKDHGFAEGGIERLGSFYYWVSETGKDLIGLKEQQEYKQQIDDQHERTIQDLCETYGLEF